MIPSGTNFFSLLIVCAAAFSVGCQSAGSQRSAATFDSSDAIRTVKSEENAADKGPIVLLSRDIQTANQQASPESSDQSLWSKLRSPTRFLLPRTDSDSATVLEPGQGLDDGF
ncbi:MAG: hypothetical protein ACI8P0_004870 [Planctomycetaceae bacterium]|jgi:hypothetical protein